MTDEEITKLMTQCCDKDKVPSFQNGFWVVTQKELTRFARRIAAKQRELDAEICLGQKYMVLQPTRIYTAYDICNAQKSAAEYLARAIRAQREE